MRWNFNADSALVLFVELESSGCACGVSDDERAGCGEVLVNDELQTEWVPFQVVADDTPAAFIGAKVGNNGRP